VNAESGFACDENGCDTYLRASKYPFENTLQDLTHKQEVREHEFACWISARRRRPPRRRAAPSTQKVDKLEGDFYSIAGAAVDAKGKLYFVDRRFNRIYSWSKEGGLAVVRDAPLDPVNLAIDKAAPSWCCRRPGQKARCTRSIPTSRPARSPSSSRRGASPRRRARAGAGEFLAERRIPRPA
jgi:hypothetical protein